MNGPRIRQRKKKQRTAHSVRLSPTEYELVAAGAQAANMTLAGFMAHSALTASRDLGRTAATIATERDVLSELFTLRRHLGHVGNNLNQAVHALHSGGYPEHLDDAIAAVHSAADRVQQVTSRILDPQKEQAA